MDKIPTSSPAGAFVAVDWGSTHIRAELWLKGRCVDRAATACTLSMARDRGFLACFEELCGAWLASRQDLTVVFSGMVGSRDGWWETPYVETPAGAEDLAKALLEVPVPGAARAYLVPGLRVHEGRRVDLMRGEETQVLGALVSHTNLSSALFCLPGTHTKWVRVEAGRITSFRTFLTGEAFGLLSQAGSLASLSDGQDRFDTVGFDAGLARSGESLGLLHHLFSARADVIAGALGRDLLPAFLSGLLIGHELRAIPGWVGEDGWPPFRIRLVGSPELTAQYARALEHLGVSSELVDNPCQPLGVQHLLALRHRITS